MRITTNGTTISGSLSEVLATLTHITQITAGQAVTAKPVTTAEVASITVTDADDVEAVAESIVAAMRTRGMLVPEDDAVAAPVPAPKPARDSVIKQAISDVKDLLSTNYSMRTDVAKFVGESLWFVSDSPGIVVTDEVLFTINADKRTVVASIRYNENPQDVYKQGRAKCAPNDVFNEHIGKAIALRRALGLEVPVEYVTIENREQDDLAVGDVVRNKKFGYFSKIVSLIENPAPAIYPGSAHKNDKLSGWNASSQVTLINDSARHTAPDLEVSRIIRH